MSRTIQNTSQWLAVSAQWAIHCPWTALDTFVIQNVQSSVAKAVSWGSTTVVDALGFVTARIEDVGGIGSGGGGVSGSQGGSERPSASSSQASLSGSSRRRGSSIDLPRDTHDYDSWLASVETLERRKGFLDWRLVDESRLYDWQTLHGIIETIGRMKIDDQVRRAISILIPLFDRQICQITNPILCRTFLSGTKQLIDDYFTVNETVCQWILNNPQISLREKHTFFTLALRHHGRCAVLFVSDGMAPVTTELDPIIAKRSGIIVPGSRRTQSTRIGAGSAGSRGGGGGVDGVPGPSAALPKVNSHPPSVGSSAAASSSSNGHSASSSSSSSDPSGHRGGGDRTNRPLDVSHLGVAWALLETDHFPKVCLGIGGYSPVLTAFLSCHAEEDLQEWFRQILLRRRSSSRGTQGEDSGGEEAQPESQSGRHSSANNDSPLSDLMELFQLMTTGSSPAECAPIMEKLRASLGDVTFREAYRRSSGRALNVFLSNADNPDEILILNHLTAPDVVVRSALWIAAAPYSPPPSTAKQSNNGSARVLLPCTSRSQVHLLSRRPNERVLVSYKPRGRLWAPVDPRKTSVEALRRALARLSGVFNVNFLVVSRTGPYHKKRPARPSLLPAIPLPLKDISESTTQFVGSVLRSTGQSLLDHTPYYHSSTTAASSAIPTSNSLPETSSLAMSHQSQPHQAQGRSSCFPWDTPPAFSSETIFASGSSDHSHSTSAATSTSTPASSTQRTPQFFSKPGARDVSSSSTDSFWDDYEHVTILPTTRLCDHYPEWWQSEEDHAAAQSPNTNAKTHHYPPHRSDHPGWRKALFQSLKRLSSLSSLASWREAHAAGSVHGSLHTAQLHTYAALVEIRCNIHIEHTLATCLDKVMHRLADQYGRVPSSSRLPNNEGSSPILMTLHSSSFILDDSDLVAIYQSSPCGSTSTPSSKSFSAGSQPSWQLSGESLQVAMVEADVGFRDECHPPKIVLNNPANRRRPRGRTFPVDNVGSSSSPLMLQLSPPQVPNYQFPPTSPFYATAGIASSSHLPSPNHYAYGSAAHTMAAFVSSPNSSGLLPFSAAHKRVAEVQRELLSERCVLVRSDSTSTTATTSASSSCVQSPSSQSSPSFPSGPQPHATSHHHSHHHVHGGGGGSGLPLSMWAAALASSSPSPPPTTATTSGSPLTSPVFANIMAVALATSSGGAGCSSSSAPLTEGGEQSSSSTGSGSHTNSSGNTTLSSSGVVGGSGPPSREPSTLSDQPVFATASGGAGTSASPPGAPFTILPHARDLLSKQ